MLKKIVLVLAQTYGMTLPISMGLGHIIKARLEQEKA